MKKIIISRMEGQTDILLGTPDALVNHGGSYTAAIGRLFQGEDKDRQIVEITHSNGDKESFVLKEVP